MRPGPYILCFGILIAPATATAVPTIGTSVSSLSFGDVDLSTTASLSLTVQNVGSDPLSLSAFTITGSDAASFGVVSPPPLPLQLAPGASTLLSVRLTPTTIGSKSATLSIYSNDPVSAIRTLPLSGFGVGPVISVSPSALAFGGVNVGESATLVLTVGNAGNRSLTGVVPIVSGIDAGSFPDQLPPLPQLGPGDSFSVMIRFQPLSVGPKNAALVLYSNDPVTPARVVGLSGTGEGPVIGVLASHNFGMVRVNDAAEVVLNVTNSGTRPLLVPYMFISGPGASAFGLQGPPSLPQIAPGQSVSLTVQFTPLSVGPKSAVLTIQSNDPDSPSALVDLLGTGIAPVVATSPDSLDFGSVNLDGQAVRVVSIRNAGDSDGGPLTVLGVAMLGDPAFGLQGLPSFPLQLAPGTTAAELIVVFHPVSAGPKSGSLVIHSDDPLTPLMYVPLAGSGLGPVIVVTPDTLDFGDVHIGVMASIQVKVSNVGGSDAQLGPAQIFGVDESAFTLMGPAEGPLPRGQYRQFELWFSPTSVGAKTVALVISSIDQSFPPQVIPVAGRGIRPEPVIAAVRDVPNDEGGKVKVSWDASSFDFQPGSAVHHYWLLRSVPLQVGMAAAARGVMVRDLAEKRPGKSQLYQTGSAAGTIYWELLAAIPALHFIEGYSYIAPTLSDSTPTSNPLTLFLVMALDANDTRHWDSAPDSGYSVDNLAPAPPTPFAGTYRNGATHLHWGRSTEADLAGYRIYRGASPGFTPGPTSLVSAQPDTGFVDGASPPGYYKLSALDRHGNESSFALLGPADILGVGGAGGNAFVFGLARPIPNPTRGETTFRFILPQPAHASLELFDQLGRKVRTLVSESLPAGPREARWDGRDGAGHPVPVGIYYARLESSARARTVRVAVIR